MNAAALFMRTYPIGIAVAAPVGAMGVLCIQRTLARGWRAGLATGLGIATADGVYAAIAALGVSAISGVVVSMQTPLRLVGGAFLVYLGVISMVRSPGSASAPAGAPASATATAPAQQPRQPDPAGLLAIYATSVGLTLTNPMTIMAFGAVFASAGLAVAPGGAGAAWATAGVACGSLTWWLVLVGATTAAHGALGERLARGVSRVSGAVIAAFGLAAMASTLLR